MAKKSYSVPTVKKGYSSPAVISNKMTYHPISSRDLKHYSGVSNYTDNRVKTSSLGLSPLLAFVVILFLFATIVRFNGGDFSAPTFTGFLEMLSNSEVITPTFSIIPNPEFGSWGIFNFLRDFIQFNIQIINFVGWICQSLTACVQYIFYFCKWLFIG